MSTDSVLLAVGVGFLGVVAIMALRKANTANSNGSASGVLGTNPVLNPAAPKTPGDFARYDRGLTSGVPAAVAQPMTTGDFARLDRTLYDYGNPAAPDVNAVYDDGYTGRW